MAKQGLIKSAFVLTFCGIICRLLGAFYRVPQASMLGSSGMGSYYLIFPVFAFLVSLSSSSIPQVLSKLVADALANNNPKQAKMYFVWTLVLLSLFGFLCVILLIGFAPVLSNLQGSKNLTSGYFAIAPAVFFVCLISCFRGYFQGYQTMTYSGISQIIEQIVKVFLGLFLTNKLLVYGVEYGVFGGLIAITISEIAALIYLFICYLFFRKKQILQEKSELLSAKDCCKKIIKTALPFTLCYIIFPLSLMLDSLFFVKLLSMAGVSVESAKNIFGINNGVVSTLTNLPIVISTGLATVIVPAISGNIKNGQKEIAESKILLALKIGILIILPCGVLFAIFPKEIIYILFGSLGNTYFNEMQVASGMLIISSVGIIYLGIFQITTAILQANNKYFVPIKSLLIGVIVRLILCVGIAFIPNVNVYTLPIASVICYMVVAMYNITALQKDFSLKVNFYSFFTAPILASILMVCVVFIFRAILLSLLPMGVCYLLSLVLGGGVYLISLILFRAFEKRELSHIFKI